MNPECIKLEEEGRFDKSAELYEQNNDQINAERCWALSAKKLETEGYLELAQDHYARAGKLDDLKRVAETNYNGDVDSVISAIETAEKQLRKRKSPLAAEACTLAGKIYLEHGREGEGNRKFLEAARKYSKFVPENEVKENLEAAFADLMKGKRYRATLENTRTAINLAKKLKKDDMLAELDESLCNNLITNSEGNDAIPYLDELTVIYEKNRSYGKLAETLEKLAKIHPKGYDNEEIWKKIAYAWKEAGETRKYEDAAINANLKPYAIETGENAEMTKKQLLEMMEDPEEHLFITGPAGSGKTTLIREFVKRTKKSCAIVAFTGIAAINVGGQTIHSFFRINPFRIDEIRNDIDDAARKSFTNLDVIIIDEISMVSRELFDEIERRMRYYKSGLKPFGGCKVIMIGDYFQLPPVPKEDERIEHVFESGKYIVIKPKNVKLLGNYRQKDEGFLKILNSIRLKGDGFQDALDKLNRQVDPEFLKKMKENCILLTTTNEHARRINTLRLSEVFGREVAYKANWSGAFANDVTGGKNLPADIELRVKNGARVMFIRNDPDGRWVNGTLGTVRNATEVTLEVALDEGITLEVPKMKFEKIKQEFDFSQGKVEPKVIGEFVQYPLRLAWAITIHKSQGQTFDSVYLDFGSMRPFAHGQTYVALSRCRTLEGLKLAQNIVERDVISEPRVLEYLGKNGLI